MIPTLAILTFLAAAAAGMVWAVRRDDGRRAGRRSRGGAGSSFLPGGIYDSADGGDGGCDAGDGGGDCGGGGD